MRRAELYTRDGIYVATVEIGPYPPGSEPDAVTWNGRIFVRGQLDRYREVTPVRSKRTINADE